MDDKFMTLLRRLIALIIDSVLVGIVGNIIGWIAGEPTLGTIVTIAIGIAYQVAFLSFIGNGQTPGKMLLGLRVVSSGGGGVSPLSAGLRYIGYLISGFVCALGYLWAIWDADSKGWHDYIAGTRVVKA